MTEKEMFDYYVSFRPDTIHYINRWSSFLISDKYKGKLPWNRRFNSIVQDSIDTNLMFNILILVII